MTASRQASPSFLLLVSKKRALTAAWKLQGWNGSGKSWRTQGMLYLAAASLRVALAFAQSGHSMSSNSMMATRAPAGAGTGGVGGAFNWAWAAGAAASTSAAARAVSRDARVGDLAWARLLCIS